MRLVPPDWTVGDWHWLASGGNQGEWEYLGDSYDGDGHATVSSPSSPPAGQAYGPGAGPYVYTGSGAVAMSVVPFPIDAGSVAVAVVGGGAVVLLAVFGVVAGFGFVRKLLSRMMDAAFPMEARRPAHEWDSHGAHYRDVGRSYRAGNTRMPDGMSAERVRIVTRSRRKKGYGMTFPSAEG